MFYRGSTDKIPLRLDGKRHQLLRDTGTTAKFFWDEKLMAPGKWSPYPDISATSPTFGFKVVHWQSNINLGPSGDGGGGFWYNQSGNYLGIRAGAAEPTH